MGYSPLAVRDSAVGLGGRFARGPSGRFAVAICLNAWSAKDIRGMYYKHILRLLLVNTPEKYAHRNFYGNVPPFCAFIVGIVALCSALRGYLQHLPAEP